MGWYIEDDCGIMGWEWESIEDGIEEYSYDGGIGYMCGVIE